MAKNRVASRLALYTLLTSGLVLPLAAPAWAQTSQTPMGTTKGAGQGAPSATRFQHKSNVTTQDISSLRKAAANANLSPEDRNVVYAALDEATKNVRSTDERQLAVRTYNRVVDVLNGDLTVAQFYGVQEE